jgi:hypothetical protein
MRLAPNQRIKPLASITLRPKNGIHVELQERAGRRVSPTESTNARSA